MHSVFDKIYYGGLKHNSIYLGLVLQSGGWQSLICMKLAAGGSYQLQMYMDRFPYVILSGNSASDYGVMDLEGVVLNIITKGPIL